MCLITTYKRAIDLLYFRISSTAHLRKIPVFAAHCLAWDTQPPHFSLETRTLTELEVKQYWHWQNELYSWSCFWLHPLKNIWYLYHVLFTTIHLEQNVRLQRAHYPKRCQYIHTDIRTLQIRAHCTTSSRLTSKKCSHPLMTVSQHALWLQTIIPQMRHSAGLFTFGET